MTSNTFPSNGLKIVKNSLEDAEAREIAARMGMTVSQFMSALAYPQYRSFNIAKKFVWPKVTDLEVQNPLETVYQYEANDNSWSLRFRALGCYNFVPRLLCEPTVVKNVTSVFDPVGMHNNNDKDLKLESQQCTMDGERLTYLLKSRSSGKLNVELPSERITPAERHKLLEDLHLSDSEEDETGAVANAALETCQQTKNILETKNPTGSAGDVIYHVEENRKKELQNLEAVVDTVLLNNNPINASSDPMNPLPLFVSPLSVMECDSYSDRHYHILSPHDIQTSVAKTSCSEGRESNVQKLNRSESSSVSNSKCDKTMENGPLTSDHSPVSSRPCLLSEKLSQPNSPTPALNESGHSLSNNASLSDINRAREPNISEFERDVKNDDYVQRILMESEIVLAAEENLMVSALSPPPASVCSSQQNNSPPNKENVENTPVKKTPCDFQSASMSPVKVGDMDGQSLTGKPLPRNLPTSEPLRSVNALPNLHAAHQVVTAFSNTFAKSSEQSVTLTGIYSSADTSSASVSFFPNEKSGLLTDLHQEDTSVSFDMNTKSKSGATNPEQQTDNEMSTAAKTNLNYTETDRKQVVKEVNGSLNSLLPEADNSIPSTGVQLEEQPFDHMPPPSSEGTTGKRQKSSSRTIETDKSLFDPTIKQTHSSVCMGHSKQDLLESMDYASSPNKENSKHGNDFKSPVKFEESPIKPTISRNIPDKQWVFANIALRKVRPKIQSILRTSSALEKDSEKSGNDILDSVRAVLSSLSSYQRSNSNEDGRKRRFRTFTGLLLVPSTNEVAKLEHAFISSNKNLPPVRCDRSTMTSSVLKKNAKKTNDAAIQCILSPVVQTETKLTIKKDNQPSPKGYPCKNYSSFTTAEPQATINKMIERLTNEEKSLHDSSVEIQLALAEECKTNASRCWKSLAAAVSSQSNSHNSGNNRSHLLLTLDALHMYPVYLIRGVRHRLAAVFLSHSHRDINRAIDLCVEVSAQLELIGRRLQRVETKLIKHRSRHPPPTSDPSEVEPSDRSMSAVLKAKQDAGWIHFWYYVLARLRSIIHSHEYQLRLISNGSLLNQINSEFGFVMQSDLSTESSRGCETDDFRPGANKPSLNHASSVLSPCNPTLVDPKPVKTSQSSNGSLEVEPLSVLIRPSGTDGVQRLLKLSELMQRSFHEWHESEKLALDVPPILLGLTDGAILKHESSISDLMSASIVDFIVTHAVDGICLNGQHTNIVVLLCFIDGIIHVHRTLLEQLKQLRATDNDNHSSTVDQQQTTSTVQCWAPSEQLTKPSQIISLSNDEKSSRTVSGLCPSVEGLSKEKLKLNNATLVSSLVEDTTMTFSGKRKLSNGIHPDSNNGRVKRKRLLKSDNQNPRDGVCTTDQLRTSAGRPNVNGRCSSSHSTHSAHTKYSPTSEIPDAIPSPERVSRKLEDHSDSDSFTHHKRMTNLSKTKKSPTQFVTNSRITSGLDDTPTELDPQVDMVSPTYTSSTLSPPPIRRRSKSLAPSRPTRRSSDDRDTSVISLFQAKRRTQTSKEACVEDVEEESTYQPKRVRPTGSHHRSRTGSKSPFPSYQPSDPNEVDRIRLHRCASVGRSLSRSHRTVTGTEDIPTTSPSHTHSLSHLEYPSKVNSAMSTTDRSGKNHCSDQSNPAYSRFQHIYPSKKNAPVRDRERLNNQSKASNGLSYRKLHGAQKENRKDVGY